MYGNDIRQIKYLSYPGHKYCKTRLGAEKEKKEVGPSKQQFKSFS